MKRVSLWRVFVGLTVGLGVPLIALIAFFEFRAWKSDAPRRKFRAALEAAERAESYSIAAHRPALPGVRLSEAALARAKAGALDALGWRRRIEGGVRYIRQAAPCHSRWESGIAFEGAKGRVELDLDFRCHEYVARHEGRELFGGLGGGRAALRDAVDRTLVGNRADPDRPSAD